MAPGLGEENGGGIGDVKCYMSDVRCLRCAAGVGALTGADRVVSVTDFLGIGEAVVVGIGKRGVCSVSQNLITVAQSVAVRVRIIRIKPQLRFTAVAQIVAIGIDFGFRLDGRRIRHRGWRRNVHSVGRFRDGSRDHGLRGRRLGRNRRRRSRGNRSSVRLDGRNFVGRSGLDGRPQHEEPEQAAADRDHCDNNQQDDKERF